jgi:type IV fimbrial biogenesis protein FimT
MRHRGFTLLELMVALTIVGMMLIAGLPSFTTFLRNAEIRSTSESIANGLRRRPLRSDAAQPARELHARGQRQPRLGNQHLQSGHGIAAATGAAIVFPPGSGKSARVLISPNNALAVTFNGLGRVVSPSPIVTPNLQQVDVTSVIAGEAKTLRIFVDDLHGVRICDPDPALRIMTPPDARAC